MQNDPCCVFISTKSAITQLHNVVFTKLKPAFIGPHLSCCLTGYFHSATAYCSTFLREMEQEQTVERFKDTVNQARNALCVMLNQLYAYRQQPDTAQDCVDFYCTCGGLVREAMDEVELCWTNLCTEECRIPDEYLHHVRPMLKEKLSTFKRNLYKSDVSQALALIIVEPVSRFVELADTRSITIYDMIYMEKLLAALEEWGNSGPLSEDSLNNLMLEVNFNAEEFIEYYYSSQQQQLKKQQSVADKLMFLEQLAEKLFRHMLAEKPPRWRGRPAVAESMMKWVAPEWRRRNQQAMLPENNGSHAAATASKRAKANFRLQFTDEPSVISAAIHMIHDSGIAKGPLRGWFEHLAEHAEFPNGSNMNAEYLMKAGRKYQDKAHERLLMKYLPSWYTLAGGKLPGKRS